MFKDNKYTKHYNLLIEKAKNRTLPKETYTEKHHIIPRSMGGNNKKENLVKLTAREHFICHWLLVKMTESESRKKMIYALMFFKGKTKQRQHYSTPITSRIYEHYRLEAAKNTSERMKGVASPLRGVPRSEETKKKLSLAKKGIPGPRMSEETKLKISASTKGKSKGPLSEEHRAKLQGTVFINRDGVLTKIKVEELELYLSTGWVKGTGRPSPTKGKKQSDETKRQISLSLKGKPSALKGRPAHNKGKPMSEEQKIKISIAGKGRIPYNKGKPSPLRGVPRSEETKKKMSDAKKKVKIS